MYLEFFGFNHTPFALSPDPDFLYLSASHKQAKSYMDYCLYKRDSLVVITGEIGSGKTTLIENMLAHAEDDLVIARIHQTQLDEMEVLQAIAQAFGIHDARLKKISLLEKIKNFMIKQSDAGKHCLLVIDEAQNLSIKALEEIRLLADIDHNKSKVANVLLVGQNQLNTLIDAKGMEQLVQRIRLRFHLGSLDQEETAEYIRTRLHCAGMENKNIFSDEIIHEIYHYTNGTPRLINIFADTLLTAAFAEEEKDISQQHVELAKQELNWQHNTLKTGQENSNNLHHAVIEIIQDKDKINEVQLSHGKCKIGRSKSNEIYLDESRVSSLHAHIISDDGRSCLVDLESTNGTKVNNKKVDEHWLEHGDVIAIGRKFTLIYKESS